MPPQLTRYLGAVILLGLYFLGMGVPLLAFAAPKPAADSCCLEQNCLCCLLTGKKHGNDCGSVKGEGSILKRCGTRPPLVVRGAPQLWQDLPRLDPVMIAALPQRSLFRSEEPETLDGFLEPWTPPPNSLPCVT